MRRFLDTRFVQIIDLMGGIHASEEDELPGTNRYEW